MKLKNYEMVSNDLKEALIDLRKLSLTITSIFLLGTLLIGCQQGNEYSHIYKGVYVYYNENFESYDEMEDYAHDLMEMDIHDMIIESDFGMIEFKDDAMIYSSEVLD